jgi:hypothetical protein
MTVQKDFKKLSKVICVNVTEDDYADLKKEADACGVTIAPLVRTRLFGSRNALRKPTRDIVSLGNIIGQLLSISGALQMAAKTLLHIRDNFQHGSADRFHLERTLNLVENLGRQLLKRLNQIEDAVTGKARLP